MLLRIAYAMVSSLAYREDSSRRPADGYVVTRLDPDGTRTTYRIGARA